MALEALLELREGDRGEIPVGVGLQVGVVVARHDEADGIDRDENLLAALFDRDTLGLARLHVQRDVFRRALDGLAQTIGLDGFDQIIHSIDLESLERVLAVGGHEHDRGRVFQALQGLGELQAGHARHAHVEEKHVDGVGLHLLDGFAHAGGFRHDFDIADLIE